VTDVGNGLLVGEADVGTLWQLAQRSDVVWIERYLPMTTMDLAMDSLSATAAPTPTGYESGTKVMNADAAYAAGLDGSGQTVAMADTGVDTGDMNTLLADLHGQVQVGYAMGLGGTSWGDPMNHGTHVAGSIVGDGMSSNHIIHGTAYGAKLVVEGMWSDIMNNIMPPAISKLFDAAYSAGARIHSNSWGAPNSNGRYDAWASQADTWLFAHPDFLAVFAAGNDGADLNHDGVIDEGTVSSPGSAKNVLTVGASKNYLLEGGIQRKMSDLRDGHNKWGVEPIASSLLSESAQGMAAFSSRGPTADGRLKPDVVAPGTNIVSARSKHPKADPAESWGIYDDNYLYMGGTSMATPLTSGAMAIVREHLLKQMGVSSVSAALMKATMANTAEDLFPGQFGQGAGQEQPTRRPNNHEGWGRVNLATLVGDSGRQYIDNQQGLATGQEAKVAVTAGSKALKVTMAYTDAPASANSAKTLVNDLDLVVISPSGATLYPNGGTSKDSVNNMEEVDVLAPEAGTYQVVVKGANVPQGKNGAQPYALVISH
jgi:subtilisin family serine protease